MSSSSFKLSSGPVFAGVLLAVLAALASAQSLPGPGNNVVYFVNIHTFVSGGGNFATSVIVGTTPTLVAAVGGPIDLAAEGYHVCISTDCIPLTVTLTPDAGGGELVIFNNNIEVTSNAGAVSLWRGGSAGEAGAEVVDFVAFGSCSANPGDTLAFSEAVNKGLWQQGYFTPTVPNGPFTIAGPPMQLDRTGNWLDASNIFSQVPATFQADTSCEVGSVTQDPHIEGFLGQHFIVDGAETGDNQVYNMVSSPWIQYNARFSATKFKHKAGGHHVPATQTTEIGLLFAGGKRVRLSLPENAGGMLLNVVVEVDGERLPTDHRIEPVELAPGVTLTYARRSSHDVRIATPHFLIEVTGRKHMFPHLDCEVKLVDWSAAEELHGLLGQTAHADKAQTAEDEAKGEVLADVFWPWYLDGELKDYHVEGNDVFGTGFVFNRF